MPLVAGDLAPPIPDASVEGPHALVFLKVTCPTCQLAAPKLEALQGAYAGHVQVVGQDPAAKLRSFGDEYVLTAPFTVDEPPYDVSNAYGIRTVPTTFVIDGDGRVADVVEAWDRDGLNRASGALARLLDVEAAIVSDAGDGLPAFKPG